MVKYSVVVLFLLSGSIFSQWYAQNSGTNYALKSVYFANENTGYTCGYNTVLKTTNAGVNWIKTTLQGNHQSVAFTDGSTGFICSDSGKIFFTTTAGNSWISQSSGTIKNLTSINFYNSSTGIITGFGKTLLKTTNSGVNWFSIANIIWEVDFLSSKILNDGTYYVTGSDSYIVKTTNGGINWIPYTHGEVNPLLTVDFINDNTGYASGCCGMFMSTTNAGLNWTNNFYLSLGFTFYSLKFVNSSTAYIVGSNGMIYRSANSGSEWDSTVTTTDETLYGIEMINENTGWVVGGYGTILKTTNGGGPGFPIGIIQTIQSVPEQFSLGQNYPNPFNPTTKIHFQIPLSRGVTDFAGRGVSINIYDVNGRLIRNVFEGALQPGSYEIDFDGSELPSGVYYYTLGTNGYRETRKMVILK